MVHPGVVYSERCFNDLPILAKIAFFAIINCGFAIDWGEFEKHKRLLSDDFGKMSLGGILKFAGNPECLFENILFFLGQ